jgi:hypothetical protein
VARKHYAANSSKVKARLKKKYHSDPEFRKNAISRARVDLLRKYGLTEKDFATLLAGQGGVCAICCTVPGRAVIDHDHDTGKVRGILCHNCNVSLGLMKENCAAFQRAIDYINLHANPTR